MGKRGQWPAKDRADYDGQWSYHGWEDSEYYRQPKGKARGKAKDPPRRQKDNNIFPSYETVELPGKHDGKGKGGGPPSNKDAANTSASSGVARNIQKAVNNLRRCENRLRRIGEEASEAKEKWEIFQDQLKKSFISERSRFHANMAKLSQERAEQEALQEQVLAGNLTAETETPAIPMAAQGEWDELMKDAEETEGLSALLSGAMHDKVLNSEQTRKQLLRLLQEHRHHGGPSTGAATPPRRPRPAMENTPPP